MVNFTIDQIKDVMQQQELVRNFSVIAHIDHGKSTLTDSLLARVGIIDRSESGNKRYMDTNKEEQERGITIKSTGISLYIEHEDDENVKKNYLFNLIDSPGHVDFSSEVTAALRVSDGAIVVVDYVEGICVQTETVVRQALQELIKPVLVINKLDRAFLELNHDPETIYKNFRRVIENFNGLVRTYQNVKLMPNGEVDPELGQVSFGSGLHNWGFNLRIISKIYAKKFNVDFKKTLSKLWGDNFYDPKTGKYSKNPDDGPRVFCELALNPICKLIKLVVEGDPKEYIPFIEKLGVKVTKEDCELGYKKLIKKVLSEWLDFSNSLVDMVVLHLPSPKQAQVYRTQYLYEGDMDDECAKAMKECDPNGPLMMFVSKMVPTSDFSRFYAFGRVFSGTVKPGVSLKIMGPNYKIDGVEDVFYKNVQKVVVMMGRKQEEVSEVVCGNTCALVGLDNCLLKQGTISDRKCASTIKAMKYSVSPVVRVAIQPKDPNDLPKLIEGLKKIAKADPLVQVIVNDKEIVVCCSGELHAEVTLNDLYNEYTNNIEIIRSNPIVNYKETITEKSEKICLAKSTNKLNRIWIQAEPLAEELVTDLEEGVFKFSKDINVVAKQLHEKYNWEINEAKKVWMFGPEECPNNVLVDKTTSVQYLLEAKDSIVSSFYNSTTEGVLAKESVRGCRYNIVDVNLHSDKVHRSTVQIFSASRRAHLGSQYVSKPRFLEPVFLAEIQVPQNSIGGVYTCLSKRRGIVFSEEAVDNTDLLILQAYLPVSESFGFTASLRNSTSGQAFPQCTFSHWSVIESDPFEKNSVGYNIMMDIRKRKGMKEEIPDLDDYLDKL